MCSYVHVYVHVYHVQKHRWIGVQCTHTFMCTCAHGGRMRSKTAEASDTKILCPSGQVSVAQRPGLVHWAR
jgi:hypothetical protein